MRHLLVRSKNHGSLRSQHLKGESALQIEFDLRTGMVEVPDGDVLTDIQFKISAAGREHESTLDGGRPDNSTVHLALDMMQDRIAIIASAAGGRISVRTEYKSIRPIDANQTQPADRLRNRTGIALDVGRQDDGRVARALTNSLNSGSREAVDALDHAAGLAVSALPGRDLYVHPVASLVLTPDGRVSRAFGGIDFEARDLRLALVEASAGRLGTLADRLTVLCSSFDPVTGRYTGAVMLALRLGGIGSVLALAAALVLLRRREAAR